jgi:hypothetical protein
MSQPQYLYVNSVIGDGPRNQFKKPTAQEKENVFYGRARIFRLQPSHDVLCLPCVIVSEMMSNGRWKKIK